MPMGLAVPGADERDRRLLTLANIVQGNDPAAGRCRERAPAHAAQARAGASPRGASPRRHGRAGRAPRSRRGVPGLRRQGARRAGRDLLTRHHAEPRPARGGRADRSVPLDERCPSHHAARSPPKGRTTLRSIRSQRTALLVSMLAELTPDELAQVGRGQRRPEADHPGGLGGGSRPAESGTAGSRPASPSIGTTASSSSVSSSR